MNKLLITLAAAFVLTTGFVACDKKSPETQSHEHKKQYSCGMKGHPVSDKPGKCPKCTMEMKEIESGENHHD